MKIRLTLPILILALGIAGKSISQSYLSGNTNVATGSTEYYEAHFEYPLHPYTMISWYVTGGTIIQAGINPTMTVYCIVEWSQTPGTGYIEVYEDLGSQTASLNILIGGVPNITPLSQVVNYGNTPVALCADMGGISIISYNWEESTDGINWTYISSSIGCYQPPAVTQTKYYRCNLEVLGGYYYTPVATVTMPSLSPGIIYASNLQPNYNTSVFITNTEASGGSCFPSSYQYVWEQSYEGSSWMIVGTGQNYPPSSVLITGKTLIRRKITCGTETLYSNTLVIVPYYVTVDFENRNYIRVITVIKKDIKSWQQADQLQVGSKLQSTTYLDGMGNAIQSVQRESGQFESGTWGDVVTHVEYDLAGRADKSFLPYLSSTTIGKFKTAARTEQETFIRNKYGEDPNSPTYSQSTYELNPLSRVLNVKAPGTGYGGDGNYPGVSNQYEFNTSTEGIRVWSIDFTTNAVPYSTTTYADGKLFKSVSIDEKLKKVYTYTDFEGKTVLKKVQEKEPGSGLDEYSHAGWLSTYYIYDDLGQLRSTVTPKAVKYLETTNWSFVSNDVYQELCFWYEFDERGRNIVKHSPAAGQIQLVYDKKDRLVLSQDENQRARSPHQWSFFLYDNLDRSVVSGLFDNGATRDVMADYVKNNLNNGFIPITIYAGANETIKADNPVAGTSTYCNFCTNTVINTVEYYDDYNYPGAKSFNSNYAFAPTNDPDVEPTLTSQRITSFGTGSKTRVIDQNFDDNNPYNDIFLISTSYYDDKGRLLQGLEDNIKSAVDYTTIQYNYSGRTLSVCEKHTMPGTTMNNFQVTSKYEYDRIGRLTILSKQFGSLGYKKLAQYSYDEYGRVRNKKLSPDFNSGAGIEDQKYDYNIQGWLTGINKDYALATTSLNQWDHFFGMYMGYENRDNKFTNKQYNGNITGAIWKTQGDNMPRRYDYQYDNANRFKAALFLQKEKPIDANWNNAKMDFSVTDIVYDENSNLTQMYQKGVIPGNNSPVYVDKLVYDYKQVAGGTWSNQLRRVFDQTTDLTATNNGALGDFKDETYGLNGEDYAFDGNGNLVIDNNKKIRIGTGNGVAYNFMDKPQKITLENKSVVEFIYDATGAKLGKKVTYTATNTTKTTWYMGDFIYEEANSQVKLVMILHEEGRIRVYQPVNNPRLTIGGNFDLPDNNKGVFEFFIKDNLQNTRMVLTEETHSEYNNCTMETVNAFYEERMFGQVDANGNPAPGANEVQLTRRDKQTWAPGWGSNSSTWISRLKQTEQKVGPNLILKVMAGDAITAHTDYYYSEAVDNSGSGNLLPSILNSLLSGLSYTAPTGPLHGSAANIINNYNANPGELGTFLSNQNNGLGNVTPQAYMNILFFDENFNFVPYDNVTGLGSFGWRITSAGDGTHDGLTAGNIRVPKNGYAFVYLSNDSKTSVYFDNLEVTHNRGRIVEENAYYPYGLKIKGISAKAFDKADNKYGYQGDFCEEEEETGWDEFELRMYDPQIGRWIGVDPYDEFASPYLGMGGDPVNNVDPDGGGIGPLGGALIGAVIGFAVPYIVDAINGKDNDVKNKVLWGIAGAFLGGGIGYGLSASLSGEGPFFMNFRVFYSMLFNFSNADRWVHSAYKPIGQKSGPIAVPNIWGNIHLGNPFQWIAASKEIITETLIASVRLGLIIIPDSEVDGYPSYSGNIPLPPNNGNLDVRIDPGTPPGYNFNFSGATPGSTNVKVDVTPDVGQIMRDRTESFRQYRQSGIDLDKTRRKVIRDAVQINNQREVKVYEVKKEVKHYKYLKIFGIRLKFIRKNK